MCNPITLLTDVAALNREVLSSTIQLKKLMDLSDDELRKEKRKQFLENLSFWVREIHLKEIINAITVKHRLKSIIGSVGYARHRSYLDYLPGVVAYINAGYD